MFGLGPLLVIVLGPRIVPRGADPRVRRSVLGTDLALALLVGGLCLLLGWRDFLIVEAPTADARRRGRDLALLRPAPVRGHLLGRRNDGWSYDDAALRGSSYLKLPKALQFFTGNIGLHHVHHLSARIPNYNLQAAHDADGLGPMPTLSLLDGLRAARLKLWDPRSGGS